MVIYTRRAHLLDYYSQRRKRTVSLKWNPEWHLDDTHVVFPSNITTAAEIMATYSGPRLLPSGACVLQGVAVCCRVLQCVAVCCSVLQCVAVCYRVLRGYVAVCCNVLQRGAVCCSTLITATCRGPRLLPSGACVLLCVAVCCSMLQYVVVCCSVL